MTLSKAHIKSINKALDYIEGHLESDLSLEKVAEAAHYSPYHFHRLFKVFTQETLHQYIARKRVEKASSALMRQREIPISTLALQFGFTSASSFTRAFKKFYGMSPSQFRSDSKNKYSKIRQVKSKNGQPKIQLETYVCDTNKNHRTTMTSTITVKSTKPVHLSGVTCIGKQALASGFENIIAWATAQGLMRQPKVEMATVFYDSFKITAADKVRMLASIVTADVIPSNNDITSITIPEGNCIVGHYELSLDDFEHAWTEQFKWMNANGYQRRDVPPFEIYHNDFNTHPEKKCIVDLYIPVK